MLGRGRFRAAKWSKARRSVGVAGELQSWDCSRVGGVVLTGRVRQCVQREVLDQMQRVDDQFGREAPVEARADAGRSPWRYLVLAAVMVTMLVAFTQSRSAGATSLHAEGGVVQCEPIRGPQWIFPADNFNRSDLFGASIESTLYESFVVNMTCSQAAGFIKSLITQTLPIRTPGALNDLTAGPGYTCIAYPDKNGHAYAGSCVSGSAKFDWNYNVMWHGVPDSSTGEGGLGIEPMGAIEYTTVLRPLGGGRYQLVVTNSSAIGAINQFTLAAPGGLDDHGGHEVHGCEVFAR